MGLETIFFAIVFFALIVWSMKSKKSKMTRFWIGAIVTAIAVVIIELLL